MTRILAVDDEPHILKLVSFSLSSHGYEVIQATNGREAVETAKREQPDLVLMDVMMPLLNGYEACKCIKEDPETGHIPVVMLSAKSQASERTTGLDSGATGYIIKPFTPKELVAQVAAVLRGDLIDDGEEPA